MQGLSETLFSTGVLMKYTDGQSDLSNHSVSFLVGVTSPFITCEFCAFVGLRTPSPIYEPPEFERGARCLKFWVFWAWELLLSCLISHISFVSSLVTLFQTIHESEPVQTCDDWRMHQLTGLVQGEESSIIVAMNKSIEKLIGWNCLPE